MKPRSTSDPTQSTPDSARRSWKERSVPGLTRFTSSAAGMKDTTSMTGCKPKRK